MEQEQQQPEQQQEQGNQQQPPQRQREPRRPHQQQRQQQQRQQRIQQQPQGQQPQKQEQQKQPQKQRQQDQHRSGGRNRTYFFSDAHLGIGTPEQDRQKERRLIEFLDFVKRDAEQVYIVGDLFDYWFEYRSVVPKGYYRLFTKLAELKERGIRLTYVVGNHDFWLKDYFQKEFGMEILRDPAVREIRGHRFLIHHGDGLVKSDRGYRILKRILRNRFNIWLFSLLHPDCSGAIARRSSRASRQYTGQRKYENSDMAAYASKKIRDENIEYVVMGHSHTPQFRRIGRGAYVNLGDWIESNTFAVFDGRRLELRNWRNR